MDDGFFAQKQITAFLKREDAEDFIIQVGQIKSHRGGNPLPATHLCLFRLSLAACTKVAEYHGEGHFREV